jgi:hypothetical protein
MRTPPLLFLLTFAALWCSCEKPIDLVPDARNPLLVVDGSIESGAPPVVFLTRSLGFFNRLSADMLAESFVRDAHVQVSDGVRTVTLRQYNIPIEGAAAVVYTVDTTNPASIMLGRLGQTYTLRIEHEGRVYEATTSVLAPGRRLDSIWWQPAPQNPDTNRVVAFARLTDPPGRGDYIRYFTARNDSAFVPGLNSVIDDAFVDGLTFNIQVFRGEPRNRTFDREEFGYFRRGDRVQIKLTNIDRATYDFWRTWEQNQSNVGNPFGVPIRVLGNISNGALGLWAGYGAQVLEMQIPR